MTIELDNSAFHEELKKLPRVGVPKEYASIYKEVIHDLNLIWSEDTGLYNEILNEHHQLIGFAYWFYHPDPALILKLTLHHTLDVQDLPPHGLIGPNFYTAAPGEIYNWILGKRKKLPRGWP